MYSLKLNSVLVDENNEKFFGNGPMRLLQGVRKTGSLSAAARAMDMSYSKANKLIAHCEEALGFKLLESKSGGKSGGFSVLSQKAELCVSLYEEFARHNSLYGQRHLDDLITFSEEDPTKIILLASGKGERFKENKLLYEIEGRPLITYILSTLSPLKDRCIVSTIHKEIARIAKDMGYVCALHEDESLSASIRAGLEEIEMSCPTMFVQADMPLLTLTSVCHLMVIGQKEKEDFVRLSYDQVGASPVLFPASCFKQLKQLQGEEGGSVVIKKEKDRKTHLVEALFPWEMWDVDTKEDLIHVADMIRYLKKEER